jgi:endonuclease IV/RimJ/RimL family protein N-acetyltransferase
MEGAILCKKGVFDYIELFIKPGSSKKFLSQWTDMDIPFVLHAPHSYAGLNLSVGSCESSNKRLVDEVESFREALNPSKIIFHPGIIGTIDETIRQISLLKKEYEKLFDVAVIENKPKLGLKGELCVGSSPEEIAMIMNDTDVGFCFDVGHSIYYAKVAKLEYKDVVNKFLCLKPDLYHLSDGCVDSEIDMHLNFGEGNFDLDWIASRIPSEARLTIETKNCDYDDLSIFESDAIYLKKLLNSSDDGQVSGKLMGKGFRLREVSDGDCELVWKWANEPIVREASFTSGLIQWEDHVKWFQSKICDPQCKFYIAVSDDETTMGQVRFDMEGDTAVISISLSHMFRDKGYGSRLIRIASQELFSTSDVKTIRSYVKHVNNSSIYSFKKAGFKREGTITVQGQKTYSLVLNKEFI